MDYSFIRFATSGFGYNKTFCCFTHTQRLSNGHWDNNTLTDSLANISQPNSEIYYGVCFCYLVLKPYRFVLYYHIASARVDQSIGNPNDNVASLQTWWGTGVTVEQVLSPVSVSSPTGQLTIRNSLGFLYSFFCFFCFSFQRRKKVERREGSSYINISFR